MVETTTNKNGNGANRNESVNWLRTIIGDGDSITILSRNGEKIPILSFEVVN